MVAVDCDLIAFLVAVASWACVCALPLCFAVSSRLGICGPAVRS